MAPNLIDDGTTIYLVDLGPAGQDINTQIAYIKERQKKGDWSALERIIEGQI